MSERLSDTAIENLDAWLLSDCSRRMTVPVRKAFGDLLRELRARRAADLTAEERQSLVIHAGWLRNCGKFGQLSADERSALAVLDKLLGGAK